ncbi:helix-turn-helix domain-containing protein [Micromonospora sp. AKA38]|uniref:helix-turn-helix domain-containing protein n=1 Tax=Micromonospora sp. AKA38 TaxID=2733861 RepID=UPI00249149CD|nr:helix-turn-helix transcriptional regulator [Micromonospora sp. AKA38]
MTQLADRLNQLFENAREDGAEPRNAEVSAALRNDQGISISPEYIRMLRTGAKANPRPELVRAIARYFGVPAGYLLGDSYGALRIGSETVSNLGSVDVSGLSPQSVVMVQALIDHLRNLERSGRPGSE